MHGGDGSPRGSAASVDGDPDQDGRNNEEESRFVSNELPGDQNPSSRRKKKSKSNKDLNIFQQFGKEHDPNPVTGVQVGGVTLYRVNLKQISKSHEDMSRFQQTLSDRTRFAKQIFMDNCRADKHYLTSMMDLRQNHNAYQRQKFEVEKKAWREKTPLVVQLRDLQNEIRPRTTKGKRPQGRTEQGRTELNPLGGLTIKKADKIFSRRTSVLTQDMARDEVDSNPSAFRMRSKDDPRAPSRDALLDSISKLVLPVEEEAEGPRSFGGSCYREVDEGDRKVLDLNDASAEPTVISVLDNSVMMSSSSESHQPKPIALLLFRNGDKYHCGETIYIKRLVRTMEEMLLAIGEQMTCFIPPVTALLDSHLQPMHYLEDLEPNKAYLCKGSELLDPPMSFFCVHNASSPSLRRLGEVRDTLKDEVHGLLYRGNVPPRSFSTTCVNHVNSTVGVRGLRMSPLISRMALSPPRIGGPPWMSEPEHTPPPAQRAGGKWSPNRKVAASLSWGGHGQHPQHHSFGAWPLAQLSFPRGQAAAGSTDF